MYSCMILLGKMKWHFFKAFRVPKWLIYTPEGTDQCAENQKECVGWMRRCIQKTQPARIPGGIRKSYQVGKALMGGGVEGGIQMSAKDQESGKTAGNNSTGALPINWGLRSGARDTVGCLPNNHSPFFSANRTVSVVCTQCQGSYDWSKPITVISFRPVSPKRKTPGGFWEGFSYWKRTALGRALFSPPFFPPAWHGSTCWISTLGVSAAILHLWGNLFPKHRLGRNGRGKNGSVGVLSNNTEPLRHVWYHRSPDSLSWETRQHLYFSATFCYLLI